MAVRTPVVEYNVNGQPNVARAKWTGLLNGDTGDPVLLTEYPDRTVEIYGTPGAGFSITLEGSNDRPTEAPTYVALTDPQGNAITKTTVPALEVVEESPLIVRPNVTAGDGTTNATVVLVCRRPR